MRSAFGAARIRRPDAAPVGKKRRPIVVTAGVARSILLGLIAVGLAIAGYAIFFASSDEDQIEERLLRLADAVRVDSDELSPLTRAARVRDEFSEIFTEDARAAVAELDEDLEGRSAIIAAATQLGVAYQSATVDLSAIKVKIDGAAAEVKATATVTGAKHGAAMSREKRRTSFQMRKADGDWRIASAVVSP
jgi:uncharacterized protein (TIGR02246 family)